MTFLAGIHGFAYFVPYLLLIGLLAMAIAYARRKRALVPVHISKPVQTVVAGSEFEFAAA